MLSKIHAKLFSRLPRLANWLLGRLELLASSRAAQAALRLVSRRHRYSGRHRQSLATEYQYSINSDTQAITVRAPHARRTPASVLRAHLPRQRQKEDALVGVTYVGTVSRFQVDLIATVAIAIREVQRLDEARRGITAQSGWESRFACS